MHVGAAGENVDAAGDQLVGERLGVRDRLALALAELLALGDLQRDGLGGDDVHEGPALLAREDSPVDVCSQLLLAEDHPAARAADRLVDRRGDDVGVGNGAGVLARGDQPGEVRHVDHQLGVDGIGDLTERREVELPRICRPAGDDHLRLVLLGEPRDLIHVDEVVLAAHVVGDDLVELARDVQLHPVGEMAAVVERHAHDRVAGIDHRHVGSVVGLGAGVRLDVGVLRAEHLLGAVDGELLGDVDPLAPAVVALARIALGVLVGEHRAGRVEHGLGDEVLGGDHLQSVLLAAELAVEHPGDVRVDLGEVGGLEVVGKVGQVQATIHRPRGLDIY